MAPRCLSLPNSDRCRRIRRNQKKNRRCARFGKYISDISVLFEGTLAVVWRICRQHGVVPSISASRAKRATSIPHIDDRCLAEARRGKPHRIKKANVRRLEPRGPRVPSCREIVRAGQEGCRSNRARFETDGGWLPAAGDAARRSASSRIVSGPLTVKMSVAKFSLHSIEGRRGTSLRTRLIAPRQSSGHLSS